MTKKMKYQDVRIAMDAIPTTGMRGHYVLGAYQVMLADLIAEIPAHRQAEYMDSFRRLAERAAEITE